MTAVRFGDAQRAARDVLRAALAGRAEPEAQGVTVGTRRPSWAADEAPAKPFVMVRLDGAGRTSRLDGTATLRVTVWHTDEGQALALASLAEALLLAGRSSEIRSVQSVVSPIPADDPDTGDPLAFFRVTAHLRPTLL